MTKIALLQIKAQEDPETNLAKTLKLTESAAKAGAQIICTPELFKTYYFCQAEDHRNFDLAETIPGPTTDKFCKLAANLNVVVIASIFEKRTHGLYHNTAVIIGPDGSITGLYRKMHIPDDPLFYEKFYFTPGDQDQGFPAWNTPFGRIAVLICWDQWFPEAARIAALAGAEIIFYPTAIGWHPDEKNVYGQLQHSSWEIIQRSHAIANGCYVAAVNRIGLEKLYNTNGIEFWGQSFVAGPSGQILAKASPDNEEILMADLDLTKINRTRIHWPFLRDRRIDAYNPISKRYIDQ